VSDPLVKVRGLTVSYRRRQGLMSDRFVAVRKLSLDIFPRECFALVGESGCGKTSVARALLDLTPIDRGTIRIGDFNLPGLVRNQRLAFRRFVQVVFQDPFLSLNPRRKVGSLIEEPLIIHGVARQERRIRLAEVVRKVRLDPELLDRRPVRLSGGQRQRVCIARALILEPGFLIADEPVSALDLSVQASIIDLLNELKSQDGLTMLFVSHDMELVQFIADRVGVMYAGRLVEIGPVAEVFANPIHPYTQALMSAVPSQLARDNLLAETPEERHHPSADACPFHPNCKLADMKCQHDMPPLIMHSPDHRVACYKYRHPY
jgi:oligopeptide transport system ATP-binding protein